MREHIMKPYDKYRGLELHTLVVMKVTVTASYVIEKFLS